MYIVTVNVQKNAGINCAVFKVTVSVYESRNININ